MVSLTLSRSQCKAADRVGGIELLIPWPADLGPAPALDLDYERDATPAERAYAERLVCSSCEAAGLVPVRVRVATLRRPANLARGGEILAHLAVTIIGRRWVHATGRPRSKEAWI